MSLQAKLHCSGTLNNLNFKYQIMKTKNGNSWLALKNALVNAQSIALVLLCFSANAQTKFIREYTLNLRSGGEALDKQALDKTDAGYVIGGPIFAGYYAYGSMDEPVFDPALIVVNEDGSLTTVQKRYTIAATAGTYKSFYAAGIKHIRQYGTEHNDGYLFHGQMRRDDITGKQEYGALIKTNMAGNVVWAKELTMTNFYGLEKPVEIRHVEQIASGKIIVLGSFNYDDAGKSAFKTVVMRIDPATGTMEWQRVLSSFGDLKGDMVPKGMIEDTPGEYYIFGHGAIGKATYVLHILDGVFAPITYEAAYFSTPGYTQATDMDMVDDELILVGEIEEGLWDHNPVFALRLEKSLNSISDLAGNSDKASLYFGTNDDPEFLYASNILINNERLVLSGYRHDGEFGPGTYGTPFNMTLSPSGEIIDLREADEVFWMKKAPTMFNATDSYVTGDKRLSGYNHYRLTSRATDGSTCIDVNINTTKNQADVSLREAPLQFVGPDLSYEDMNVVSSEYPVTAFNLCEGCTTTLSEDMPPITTSTGEASFCTGSSIDLYAPLGFGPYSWFHDGEPFGTGGTISITEGGTYSVMCYDEEGCEVEVIIEILEYEFCEIEESFPEKTYCSLELPTSSWVGWFADPLEGCNGSYSYSWTLDGGAVPGMMFGDHATPFVGPGTYTVTVTTPCGPQVFSQTVTDDLTIVPGAAEALPKFYDYIGPNVWFEMANYSAAFDYYQWDLENLTTMTSYSFGGPSPFYGAALYAPNSGETLSVTLSLTDIAACTIYKNNITYIDGPGKRGERTLPAESAAINVYPNPSNGRVTFDLPEADTPFDVKVVNVAGVVVFTADAEVGKVMLDLSDQPSGVYTLLISSSTELRLQKIIIQH